MRRSRGCQIVLAGIAAALTVTGCAGEAADGAGEQSTASALVTSSAAATTSSDPEWPEVTFDACRDIPDEALRSTGLDPSTKDPDASRTATSIFLNCLRLSEPRGSAVNILAMNRTFDSYVEKEAGGDIRQYELEGRRAVAVRESGAANCYVSVETSFGFLTLNTNTLGSKAPREQWCDGIEDMMRVYLQYLPEGA